MYYEEQGVLLVGIDHGFQTMKTNHFIYENGVTALGGEATLTTNTMLVEGSYFKVGEGRLPMKDTKTEDNDYFLLTLAGIAKEMEYYDLYATDVILAAGLPFTRFGQEKEAFTKYLKRNRRIDFNYCGRNYEARIVDVYLYPQCYAAVADRLTNMSPEQLIVDIGSKTIDIIHTSKYVPVEKDCVTIPEALIQCMAAIKNVVYRKTNHKLSEQQIQQVMMTGTGDFPEKLVVIVQEELRLFAKGIEAKLKELGFEPELTPIVYLGGGASVMRMFGSMKGPNICYLEDVRANAIGYEYIASRKLFK